MKSSVKFVALTLVAALGLTACGDSKSKKKNTQVEAQQTEDVAPTEKPTETVTPVESNTSTETVVVEKTEEKPEAPATPASGSTDEKGAGEEKGTEEGKEIDPVLCTADVVKFCVKGPKGTYQEISFGRSAPECKFPEKPADAVDDELCRPELTDSKAN